MSAAMDSQLVPLSRDSSSDTVCTDWSSLAVHVMSAFSPTIRFSPPLGYEMATDGSASGPIVKLPALVPDPLLPAGSCAVTRTRAVVVLSAGTVHVKVPVFGTSDAIEVGNVAPPSV